MSLARARTFLRPPDLLAPFAFAGAAELVVFVERLGVARDALLLMPLEGPPRHDLQHNHGAIAVNQFRRYFIYPVLRCGDRPPLSTAPGAGRDPSKLIDPARRPRSGGKVTYPTIHPSWTSWSSSEPICSRVRRRLTGASQRRWLGGVRGVHALW